MIKMTILHQKYSDDSISLPTGLQQDQDFTFSERAGCNNGEQSATICAAMVLQWWDNDATMVLQWWDNGVTMVEQWYNNGATIVLGVQKFITFN